MSAKVFVYPTERRMEAYVPEAQVDPYDRVAEQNRAYRKRTTLQDLVTFAENRGHQVLYTEDRKLHRIPPSAQIIVQTRAFPTVVVATYRVAKDSPRNDTRQPWNVHLTGEKSFADLHPRVNGGRSRARSNPASAISRVLGGAIIGSAARTTLSGTVATVKNAQQFTLRTLSRRHTAGPARGAGEATYTVHLYYPEDSVQPGDHVTVTGDVVGTRLRRALVETIR